MLDYNASVLLIYTGGTIGMIEDPDNGTLKPYDFSHLKEYVPELKRLKFNIDSIPFRHPIDSSDMNPEQWKKIVWIIEENYDKYDGFVILHGTDTMAYSASALSFMLENLNKPVILTGSQLPIGKIRTDGKENLITALEIAVDKDPDGKSFVQEVCIFFQTLLMRGNRTTKISASYFKAFNSFNFPVLAEAGTRIHYRHDLLHHPLRNSSPKFHSTLDSNVAIVKIFPGMSADILKAMIAIPRLKGIVLETYGAGNSPGEKWFLDIIEEAVNKGMVVVNVTQCASGSVDMMRYVSGKAMKDIGVISGYDITTEAAVAKLMFLFGLGLDRKEVKTHMKVSLVGEATIE
ncbi:MAG: asparaginase [Dysgonamonadaceae bacterium]|jgi:L-asparaginase|nr:asparaginase [Dysgonamonadaceae bacterium]